MKTLILYASKYGAGQSAAQMLAVSLDEATLCNVRHESPPPLENFEFVIIGGSIYAGSVHKKLKLFITENSKELINKTKGIFLTCFSENQNYFEKNFPKELLESVENKEILGGIFDPEKAGKLECFIIKNIMKQKDYINTLNDEKINNFIKKL